MDLAGDEKRGGAVEAKEGDGMTGDTDPGGSNTPQPPVQDIFEEAIPVLIHSAVADDFHGPDSNGEIKSPIGGTDEGHVNRDQAKDQAKGSSLSNDVSNNDGAEEDDDFDIGSVPFPHSLDHNRSKSTGDLNKSDNDTDT